MIQLKLIHVVAVAVSVMEGCHGDYHHGDYTSYANYYPEYSFNYSAPTSSNSQKRIFSDEITLGKRTRTTWWWWSCFIYSRLCWHIFWRKHPSGWPQLCNLHLGAVLLFAAGGCVHQVWWIRDRALLVLCGALTLLNVQVPRGLRGQNDWERRPRLPAAGNVRNQRHAPSWWRTYRWECWAIFFFWNTGIMKDRNRRLSYGELKWSNWRHCTLCVTRRNN